MTEGPSGRPVTGGTRPDKDSGGDMEEIRMDGRVTLVGRVVSGLRQAAYFTRLDWVQEQCMEKLGFRPWPGTLNLEVSEDSLHLLETLRKEEGPALVPPDPRFCEARIWPLSIGKLIAAIVIPAEDVNVHGKRIIEIIAPLRLKDALDLHDGDSLELTLNTGITHTP